MNGKKCFKWAAWAMIITGLVHLIGHFAPPNLDTTEKEELMRLLNNVPFNLDPWYTRTFMNLFNAFSLFLTVLLLTLGGVNWIISNTDLSNVTIKKIVLLNLSGMMMMVALSLYYAFSIPITLFLIIVLLLGMSYRGLK